MKCGGGWCIGDGSTGGGRIEWHQKIKVAEVTVTPEGNLPAGCENDVRGVDIRDDVDPASLRPAQGEKGFEAGVGDCVGDADSVGRP